MNTAQNNNKIIYIVKLILFTFRNTFFSIFCVLINILLLTAYFLNSTLKHAKTLFSCCLGITIFHYMLSFSTNKHIFSHAVILFFLLCFLPCILIIKDDIIEQMADRVDEYIDYLEDLSYFLNSTVTNDLNSHGRIYSLCNFLFYVNKYLFIAIYWIYRCSYVIIPVAALIIYVYLIKYKNLLKFNSTFSNSLSALIIICIIGSFFVLISTCIDLRSNLIKLQGSNKFCDLLSPYIKNSTKKVSLNSDFLTKKATYNSYSTLKELAVEAASLWSSATKLYNDSLSIYEQFINLNPSIKYSNNTFNYFNKMESIKEKIDIIFEALEPSCENVHDVYIGIKNEYNRMANIHNQFLDHLKDLKTSHENSNNNNYIDDINKLTNEISDKFYKVSENYHKIKNYILTPEDESDNTSFFLQFKDLKEQADSIKKQIPNVSSDSLSKLETLYHKFDSLYDNYITFCQNIFDKQNPNNNSPKDNIWYPINYFKDCGNDKDEIRKRYLELMNKNHPDNGGDEEIVKIINAQYNILHN